MSAALVRQALEFVDPDENSGRSNKKRVRPAREGASGQVTKPEKKSFKKQGNKKQDSKKQNRDTASEAVKKLLNLSRPTIDDKIAAKVVERAVKGKPLVDKIEVKDEPQKSILFPDEDFEQFEEELFCS